jgi:hypothetical protein
MNKSEKGREMECEQSRPKMISETYFEEDLTMRNDNENS